MMVAPNRFTAGALRQRGVLTGAAITFGRYYGLSVLTCKPADPASKGGAENVVNPFRRYSNSSVAS